MDQDLFCLICRESYGDFLPRCNHRYHLECLTAWFEKQKMECPLCRGHMSKVQLVEDLIAKRTNPACCFKVDPFKQIDEQTLKLVFEYKIAEMMTEILKKGVDLVIPAFRLRYMGIFKEFMENELDVGSNSDKTYITIVKTQLKIVDYLLKTNPDCISDSVFRAGRDGNLDIVKYFIDISPCFHSYSVSDKAALNGHFEIVKYLSVKKLNDNEVVNYAIRGGHLEIMKYLIRKNKISDMDPLLKEAIKCDQREIINYITEDMGYTSPEGITMVADMGNFEMVKYFTEMSQPCPYEAIDGAASKGHFDIAKYLINHGRNYCTLEIVDNAASKGYTKLVKYLVQNGKPYSYAAFESGYKNGNFEIVKCLIEDGHPCSSEALDYAAEHGFTEIVKYLVGKENGKLFTCKAIDEAASGGYYEIVRCLVEDGRPFSSKAVVEAAKAGHLEIVTYLLECAKRFTDAIFVEAPCNGNLLAERFKSGSTPETKHGCVKQCSVEAIDGAATAGHFEIVQLLLDYGNKFTLNAIRGAADNGYLQMIQLLMQNEGSFMHVVHDYEKRNRT